MRPGKGRAVFPRVKPKRQTAEIVGPLSVAGAEMNGGSRELRILGRAMDGNFGPEAPVFTPPAMAF